MGFFKEIENASIVLNEPVPALHSYLPNSIIYTALYSVAIPPNLLLLYMGMRNGLITSRVKYPTLGMTLANLFGLFGFLLMNAIYLFSALKGVSTFASPEFLIFEKFKKFIQKLGPALPFYMQLSSDGPL